ARTMNELGLALKDFGCSSEGQKRGALFDQSLDAFQSALLVSTHEAAPVSWAMIQVNLGNLRLMQSTLVESNLVSPEEGKTFLLEAEIHVRASLSVFDEEQFSEYRRKALRVLELILSALQEHNES